MGMSKRIGTVMAMMRTAHLWLHVWDAVDVRLLDVGPMLPPLAAMGGGLPPRATIYLDCGVYGFREGGRRNKIKTLLQ